MASGIGASTSSSSTRSGLLSAFCSTMPPRTVRTLEPAGTTDSSRNELVGPVTCGWLMPSHMPSSDSQKSRPSVAGSNVPVVSTSPLESSSITVDGGTRPPGPTIVGAGTDAAPVTVIVGLVSSVVVRLSVPPEPPGRNSATVPLTVTASPTFTVGAELVKTNRPSLVAGSASGCGSWNQNPLPPLAVTTPVTLATSLPFIGDRCAEPWMSWILASTGSGSGGVEVSVFGDGLTAANSVLLLSVSAVGTLRVADVVFDRPGAAAVSKSLAVP